MIPAIEITINVLWIGFFCFIFAVLGFILRSARLSKLRQRISDLEKEMLQNHSEILALQKENILLENQIKNNPVPVIPISSKENNPENDNNNRKKLLTKSAGANQHS